MTTTWKEMAEEARASAKMHREISQSDKCDPIWSEYEAQMAETRALLYEEKAKSEELRLNLNATAQAAAFPLGRWT